jgi:hypothetical protein
MDYNFQFQTELFFVSFQNGGWFENLNGGQFSMGCYFFLLNIFSIAFLHCVCVEKEKNCGRNFSFRLKMAPLARGFGQKWFFCRNF